MITWLLQMTEVCVSLRHLLPCCRWLMLSLELYHPQT